MVEAVWIYDDDNKVALVKNTHDPDTVSTLRWIGEQIQTRRGWEMWSFQDTDAVFCKDVKMHTIGNVSTIIIALVPSASAYYYVTLQSRDWSGPWSEPCPRRPAKICGASHTLRCTPPRPLWREHSRAFFGQEEGASGTLVGYLLRSRSVYILHRSVVSNNVLDYYFLHFHTGTRLLLNEGGGGGNSILYILSC